MNVAHMSMRAGWLAVALAMLPAALTSCAQNASPSRAERTMLEPARNAEARGDLETAFDEYEGAARDGVAVAQYRLGRMYEKGIGTAPSDEQAARWYRPAVESGYPPAEIALGKLYEQGRGVPQDFAAALALYKKAVEYEQSYEYQLDPSGSPFEAHVRAGQLIELGRGTRADASAAARYYRVAAEAGNPDGQFALAELYREGEGVAADPAAAERWYAAAAAGYADPDRADDTRAQGRLGQMYLYGRGVPKDVARGLSLLEGAARNDRVSAQTRLARLFREGDEGLAADPARAAHYYQMAAGAGNAGALYELAGLHATGDGVPQDGRHAVELYQEAAAAGEAAAYGKIGDLYAAGELVRQDDAKANELFAKGARHGDGRAAFRLAEAYENGAGVASDPVQALSWYQIAQALGEERASDGIERIEGQLEAAQVQQAERLTEKWQRDHVSD